MTALPGVEVIRQRVATAVAAALPGVRESVFHPKLIGYDGGGIVGAFFAVEVPSTRVVDPRSRVTTRSVTPAVRVLTTVVIRYLHRLKTETARASYDEAIVTELAILASLGDVDYSQTNALQAESVDREVIADGSWVLITITGTISHGIGGDG